METGSIEIFLTQAHASIYWTKDTTKSVKMWPLAQSISTSTIVPLLFKHEFWNVTAADYWMYKQHISTEKPKWSTNKRNASL